MRSAFRERFDNHEGAKITKATKIDALMIVLFAWYLLASRTIQPT